MSKPIKLDYPPIKLTIETTAACNLRCVMCSQSVPGMIDRPKHMDTATMEKLQSAIEGCQDLQLHGIGEPFLSPSFWLSLNYLKPTTWSVVNSNFTLLDRNMARKLIDSNLKAISVSLDAATPETYKKIRGFDFDEVISNLNMFVEERNKAGKEFPIIFCNMTLMRENIDELLPFIKKFGEEFKCYRVECWPLNNFGESNKRFDKRSQWEFNYEEQGPWNFIEYYNQKVAEARDYAIEKGISFAYKFY